MSSVDVSNGVPISEAELQVQNMETGGEINHLQQNNIMFDILSADDVLGKEFKSIEEAETFYYTYAKATGFDVRKDEKYVSTKSGRITLRQWVCSAEGERRAEHMNNNSMVRTQKKVTRFNCPCLFKVRYFKEKNSYVVVDFKTDHTHRLANPDESHLLKSHRSVPDSQLALASAMQMVPIRICHAYQYMVDKAGGYTKVGFTIKDLYNKLDISRRETSLAGDAEAALSYLRGKKATDKKLFCKYSTDENNRLANLFWRDSDSWLDYSCFGDVLVFDATYKTNHYGKPLVLFAGSNHHLSTIIFGFALLFNETAETYIWALQVFLESMGGMKPKSVLTDGDEAMRKAIEVVFPDCPHRLCTWHIGKNVQHNLHKPEVVAEFRRCMFDETTPYGFEQRWKYMVNKFQLHDKVWVRDMYEKRHKWAEAFISGKFYARMRSTQRCEGMNNCVKDFLSKGIRLFELIQLLDTALARLRNNALGEEFRSNNSNHVLTTPLRKLEKHASNVYTDNVFYLVREEIMRSGGLITSRVMRVSTSRVYITSGYNSNEQNECTTVYHHQAEIPHIVCSCQLFEHEGIPCCHSFNLMKHERMEEIHSSLVLKRWTKLAKSNIESTILSNNNNNNNNNNSMPSESPELIRHGDLSYLGGKVSYLASKTTKGTDILRNELIKLEPVLEEILDQQKDVSVSPSSSNSILKDPVKVRSKGMQGTERSKGPKTKRKCSLCKNYGHTKPRCPKKNRVRGRVTRVNQAKNVHKGKAHQPPKKKTKVAI